MSSRDLKMFIKSFFNSLIMFSGSLSSLYRTTCPYKRFGETKLLFPFGVSCNETGDVFVSDWEAGMIYQVRQGMSLSVIGKLG